MRKVKNPSAKTLYARKWRESNQRQCVGCGNFCSYEAIRCRRCNSILFNAGRKKKYYCKDCGVRVSDKLALRCKSCAGKWQHGEHHPNWKGGRIMASTGYIRIKCPEHFRADKKGYVFEHILAWEQAHGKPVPKGWIIHHLNGIKGDNRTSNLKALPSKKHYLVLGAKAKRIQQLEALLNGQNQLL